MAAVTRRALQRLRCRLDDVLPIDGLTTHYPDRQGRALLNVDLSQTTPSSAGKQPPAAGARETSWASESQPSSRANDRRGATQLHKLLTQHTPHDVLACVAGLLMRATDCSSPPSPHRCRRGTR